MSDKKITDYTALTAPAAGDLLPIVDISDATMGGTGTNKKMTYANLLLAVLGSIYPIGSIYTEITGVNPATTFGFGTWTAWGTGKVPIGVDTGDTDFNTVEKTGGAKTSSVAHTHAVSGNTGAPGSAPKQYADGSSHTAGDSTHQHSVSITSAAMSANATPSIVQPFVTCYFWKRTA